MQQCTCNVLLIPPPHAVATATATIITTEKLRNCGSIPDNSKRYFSSPKYPNWFWDQPSLLLNGHHRPSGPVHEADLSPSI